jgi:pimeloyl-ACP methyl ester carboxylesterase
VRAPKHLTRFLAASVALVAAGALSIAPSSAAPQHDKPTIVLVHGAFADGSSWNKVIEKLQRRGYPVVATANPLRSVAGDAAATKSVLDSIEGPVVLVGHSYGGEVITNAALNDADVKALVYVAAFLPEQGETALGLSNQFPGSTLGPTLKEVPLADGGTDLYVHQELFPKQFAADIPLSQAKVLAAGQRPVTAAALTEPSGAPAWKTIPSWSLIPTQDKNIPLQAQRFMAQRAHATTVEVNGASHAVLLSQPDKVTDLIIKAAEARR